MQVKGTNVIDKPIRGIFARSGMTSGGRPLALNRAPAPDLAPWLARIVIVQIDAASSFHADCGVCSDIAYQRILIDGEWEVETRDGTRRFDSEPVLVGPHTHFMPMRCKVPLTTMGLGFRPGALRALTGIEMPDLIDRIEPGDPFGLLDHGPFPQLADGATPDDLADALEERFRRFLNRADAPRPSAISAAFEHQSFVDPTILPRDFASSHNVSLRTLERLVQRDFGTTPRTVLRRARALDLASQLLGIGHEEEASDLLLRFFDQSHSIREFQAFFGMTPQALRANPRILLTISLETRAARRLEELRRIGPDEPRPWQVPSCDAASGA